MAKDEVFVNQDNMALLHCPHCGKMKHVSVAKFKNIKHSLQVKCSCGKTFSVNLNFRKRYRKDTDLIANFKNTSSPGNGGGSCRIVNVSLGGLGLRVEEAGSVEPGDILKIVFKLDDKKQSSLSRQVVVRHIGQNGYVGTQFCDEDDKLYEKTLGFYLMP